jgi:hypothetical protein
VGAQLLATVVEMVFVLEPEEFGIWGLGGKNLLLQLPDCLFGGLKLLKQVLYLGILFTQRLVVLSAGLLQLLGGRTVLGLKPVVSVIVLMSKLGIGAVQARVDFGQSLHFSPQSIEGIPQLFNLGVSFGDGDGGALAAVRLGVAFRFGECAIFGDQLLDPGLEFQDLHALSATHTVGTGW